MDSNKTPYSSFPLEWTVKTTSYQIRYRKAFNINEIDEVFCSIINAKGNKINFSELGRLLGFNLEDLAETDIFQIYLKALTEYTLIEIDKELILLTDFGLDALQSNLKYKYYFAATELLENQTATGESLDFSFKSLFDIENSLSQVSEITKEIFDSPQLKQKLQLQLFGSDIYKGEIIELYQTDQYINYKSISLECELFEVDNSFQLTIYKGGINKPDIQFLIELTENEELKSKLMRRGMYHHILSDNNSIGLQDIQTYLDLWNWKELAENPKTDWNDKNVFKLFLENGDGSVWSNISEKAPVESIKSVIDLYAEYWNWSKLTERFDDDFINEQIETYNWDFEELSYKETEFVISLLSNTALKVCDWDWNYLSKNLPDKFIEENIEDFAWDFYEITVSKNEVFKNIFIKYKDKLDTLISKNWNWRFISEEINLNFLHKNISAFASKLDWHIVLYRFFNNAEIIAKCLKEESFKSLLKQYLPDNFVVAHQKYLWSTSLIDFFEQQNLIQWESKAFINGFDTNENVEWDNTSFVKYNSHITTEAGFLKISKQISDYSLIEEFPDFAWNWEGISKNKYLIDNLTFIEKAFVGEFSFSNNLHWSEILSQSTFDVSFWNKNLEAFNNVTNSEKQSQFWASLTQKQKQEYIFTNSHFPWDWTFITENSTVEKILDSFDDIDLFEKWDWKIATRKLDKETILKNINVLSTFIDWEYLINEVYRDEIVFENQELKIAYRLSHLQSENRKLIWHLLTTKYPFSILFPIVNATYQFDVFEWDWTYISNHIHFPTDFETLNRFKEKINWAVFSENNAIQKKFNPKTWNSGKEWFNNVDSYLQRFHDKWDWKVLSQNRNINYNRPLLQKYKGENWDWDYLTEFGRFLLLQKRDSEKYLEQILKQFPKINFDRLSHRIDININSDLILSTKDKNWDWQILSKNKKAEISIELILELKNKNWNWKAISQREKIDFTNETFLQLLDKDWDWGYLSSDTNIEFNAVFIERTKSKPWNWKKVSRHKSFVPTIELLSLTKDFDLDWEYLSKHSGLNPTKELLAKFENKWDWHSITKNPQINFTDIAFIERFAAKWNWRFICKSGKLLLNSQVLNKFREHLEWDLISSNTNLLFTKELIQEFYELWNWSNLKNNKRIEHLKLLDLVNDFISNDPILYFIVKISEQQSKWKNCVFHFTNIDNAVKIINDKRIKSRKSASQLSNASGILTYQTRKDPEKFARFYFRTETPTQHYNEGLFKNNQDYRYRNLGYPKCPIMIYFKTSLQEILFKNRELNNIYLSNGNMQRNNTKYGQLKDMIKFFNYEDLFKNSNETPKGYPSQQELMFLNDVSLLDLDSLEIIFEKEADMQLFKRMTGGNKSDFKLKVDNSIYEGKNDKVFIDFTEDEVQISSNYNQQGYLKIIFDNFIPNVSTGEIIKIDKVNNTIYFNRKLIFPITFQDFKLYFIEEIENYKQEWILGTQKEFNHKNEPKIYQR